MLDVSAELVRYLPQVLAAERRRRGTPVRSRKLSCRDQAVLTQRWAAPQHITADPDSTTEITSAALVLTKFEHKYIS